MTDMILSLANLGFEISFGPMPRQPDVIYIALRRDGYIYRRYISTIQLREPLRDLIIWETSKMVAIFPVVSVKENPDESPD